MSGVPYWIWKDFSEKEQGQFLGLIQGRWLLVELDEATQVRFYNEKFALEVTWKYEVWLLLCTDFFFRIYLASIDDTVQRGSKLKDAEKLLVPNLDEDNFIQLLGYFSISNMEVMYDIKNTVTPNQSSYY